MRGSGNKQRDHQSHPILSIPILHLPIVLQANYEGDILPIICYQSMEMTPQKNSPQKKDEPVIQTEIFDTNLPSELLESTASTNTKPTIPSPSSIKMKPSSSSYALDGSLESYQIKGKSIFKQTPSYQTSQTISISLPTISAKFPSEGGQGLKSLWESFVGHCKREIYINEGFIYVLQKRGAIGYYVHKIWALDDLFKTFYDRETGKVRLVFAVGHLTETKDFQITDKVTFFERLKDQLGRIGRQM